MWSTDPDRDVVDRVRNKPTSGGVVDVQQEKGSGSVERLLTPDHAGNVVGVDPHKRSLSATVVDPRGGLLAGEHFRVSGDRHRALEAWARQFGPIARWGIEGASSTSRGGHPGQCPFEPHSWPRVAERVRRDLRQQLLREISSRITKMREPRTSKAGFRIPMRTGKQGLVEDLPSSRRHTPRRHDRDPEKRGLRVPGLSTCVDVAEHHIQTEAQQVLEQLERDGATPAAPGALVAAGLIGGCDHLVVIAVMSAFELIGRHRQGVRGLRGRWRSARF